MCGPHSSSEPTINCSSSSWKVDKHIGFSVGWNGTHGRKNTRNPKNLKRVREREREIVRKKEWEKKKSPITRKKAFHSMYGTCFFFALRCVQSTHTLRPNSCSCRFVDSNVLRMCRRKLLSTYYFICANISRCAHTNGRSGWPHGFCMHLHSGSIFWPSTRWRAHQTGWCIGMRIKRIFLFC